VGSNPTLSAILQDFGTVKTNHVLPSGLDIMRWLPFILFLYQNRRSFIYYVIVQRIVPNDEGESNMTGTAEYYENIPPKQCCSCGAEIEEQHESYAIECERCVNQRDD
jgi:hypothetical protein